MDGGLDLDIDLDLVGKRGRRAVDVEFRVVRELRAADFAIQATAPGVLQPLKRLTSRHHSLARLIASGTAPGEAAIVVGLEGSWVSTLQRDPAFIELVEHYRTEVEGKFEETVERLAGFSRDVLEELQGRLIAEPEKFTNNELKGLLTETLDRTGLGPSSTQKVDVSIDLASRLNAGRERALAARRAEALPMKDITPDE